MVAERLGALALTVVLLGVGSGCAGARTSVVADEASYPISLSRAVRDQDGTIAASERMKKVGTLRVDATAWGIFYSAIKLTPRTDISPAVNEQVAKAGGDAVVNLRIRGGQCAADFFAFFTAIPIWPGCASIEIEGDIVKVTREGNSGGAGSARSAAAQ